MAFVDALGRKIKFGWGRCKITLAGTVVIGDPIMYSTGWKLAANTAGAPAVLVAAQDGVSGDVIDAYVLAVVECTNTLANKATMGEIVAVDDTGIYAPAGAGLQDIGYAVEDLETSTKTTLVVWPSVVAIDTAGT